MSSKAVLLIGETGSGKSHSIQFLNPEETFIINVYGKPLPFRYGKMYKSITEEEVRAKGPVGGNLVNTSDPTLILQILNYVSKEMPHIKNIILDDWQYAAADEFMSKAMQKGYDKFTEIALHIWEQAIFWKNSAREDLMIVYITHPDIMTDINGNMRWKAKTVGRLVDDKLTLDGMYTIVINTVVTRKAGKSTFNFLTLGDGKHNAKSPSDMFNELEENNLQVVREKIMDYYHGE